MIQFDEEDSILQAKYAIREKRHPNQWPKCEKIDNKNSVNLFKSFQYKFPETLIIDEKDSISTKEFQEKQNYLYMLLKIHLEQLLEERELH